MESRNRRLETLTTLGINLTLRVREVELSISMPWALVGAWDGWTEKSKLTIKYKVPF